jgi:hypothetical protein
MTLLQFSADGTFGNKHDFALGSDKVLKIVTILITSMEKDGYVRHVSDRILTDFQGDNHSEPTYDIVSGDES